MPVDRSRLPALGAEPPFTFPEIRRQTLSNGVRVWTVEHRDVPVVSTLVLLPAGSAADPDDRPGLAAMTGDLLDEGSGDLDALQIHEALGRIGAQLDTEVGSDATLIGLTTLERFAARGVELLASIVTQPRFDPHEFERVRELRLNRLLQLRDMPPALAERAFAKLLYGRHPYGHLAIGTEDSVRATQLEDVLEFHRSAYSPAGAMIIVTGDGSHAALTTLAENAFGSWADAGGDQRTGSASGGIGIAAAVPAAGDRLAIVHRGGAAQSELRIGHIAASRSTPDYHALLVLNMILGGQFVSRINMNLRESKGYTYGARTSFDFRKQPGPFVLQASVQSDVTADAIREAIGELRAIRADRPVTREELALGRAALTRGYPRNFETGEQMGRAAAQLALYGLRDDYFTTFQSRVLALDEQDITRVAAEHIRPEQLKVVIVGDRDKFGTGLEDLGLGPLHDVAVV